MKTVWMAVAWIFLFLQHGALAGTVAYSASTSFGTSPVATGDTETTVKSLTVPGGTISTLALAKTSGKIVLFPSSNNGIKTAPGEQVTVNNGSSGYRIASNSQSSISSTTTGCSFGQVKISATNIPNASKGVFCRHCYV